jgi:hypothetical protein
VAQRWPRYRTPAAGKRAVVDDAHAIRPETRALDAFIQTAVEDLLSAGARGEQEDHALLFLGNWHDAMPRLIFQDPVLQPVDTRIWGVIKIAATGSGPASFPTYQQIAKTANVGSEATVARSMAILRATRWLTLCRRVRDGQGRFRGNVYALHDEPLPLADTLHLDRTYLQFLNQCLEHAHARVHAVAEAVLGTIEDDARAGRTVTESENPLERRVAARQALEDATPRHHFFSLSAHRLQNLKSATDPLLLQNLKPEPLQNLKSGSSSCLLNKTTTTTTTTTDTEHTEAASAAPDDSTRSLVVPETLAPNERLLARMYVKNVPAALRQNVLDEFAGRLKGAKTRGEPIANPVGYLARLCKAAATGAFTLTSLGVQVQQARRQDAYRQHLDALGKARAAAHLQELLHRRRADRGVVSDNTDD